MNYLLRVALQVKNNIMTAPVAMLLKSRTSHTMLPFSLCNKKGLAIRHMNSFLFPTKLSIPSYYIEKLVGLRTYHHFLVHQLPVYPDDVNLLVGSVRTIKEDTESLLYASKEIGIEVNADKSQYIVLP